MNVTILDRAKNDIRDGRVFYELQGGRELGAYFMDTVFAEIDSLSMYAGIHVQRFGMYMMLVHHFPYAVYYMIEGDEVKVYAVVDCRRDPKWIRGHVSAARNWRANHRTARSTL